MHKRLFFLDSKTLDWLTPYILDLASDAIAFNVFCANLCICGGLLFPESHAIFNGYLLRGWLCCRILVTQMVCIGKVRVKG